MSEAPPDRLLNFGMVCLRGERIQILNPRVVLDMSKDEALQLAAWIVALAEDHDPDLGVPPRFAALLKAICG